MHLRDIPTVAKVSLVTVGAFTRGLVSATVASVTALVAIMGRLRWRIGMKNQEGSKGLDVSFVRGWDTYFVNVKIRRGEEGCLDSYYIVVQVALLGEMTLSYARKGHIEKDTK